MLLRPRRILTKPRAIVRFAALATTGVCLACGERPSPAPPRDNSVTIVLESGPIQLDPRLGADQASSRVFELALDGLVSKNAGGEIVPALATSWQVLDAGLRWRFRLRPGVRFQDGRPFSSADVVWTLQTMLDGRVPSPKRGAFAAVERVEAADPSTVDFVLKEPNGALAASLTSECGILPAGTTPEEANRALVGTGPFRLAERVPDRFVFVANDAYFGGRPALDRVTLKEVPDATVRALELEKGSAQLAVNALPPDDVPLFEKNPAFRVVRTPGSNYAYLGLNLVDPILAHPEVRRALALALDRPRLVATLWRGLGTPTETLMAPGHWARAEIPPIPHDVAEARRLLDAAGFPDPDGAGGPRPRFTLTYKTSTDETALLQAQIVQAMAAEAGIRIDIRSFEFATFFQDIQRGSFQLFSLTWTGVVDPDLYATILHSARVPPRGSNRGHYSNPEFDALVEAGGRLSDPRERRPYYVRAQEILARDLPYISLFHRTNVAVMARALEGYESFPSGELLGVRKLHWRRGT